ncbi:hypothetical protein SCA6_013381 [Theobroma cacao]
MAPVTEIRDFRFQEIVPLNAGNVLVLEDNEPAAKWLALINQALNRPHHDAIHSSPDSGHGSKHSNSKNSKESKSPASLHFFHKPALKVLSKNFRADCSLLKTCNCPVDSTTREKRRQKKLSDLTSKLDLGPLPVRPDSTVDELVALSDMSPPFSTGQMGYRLIASKQMVGIFVSVWARKELVPYIAHLRVSSVGRGIMGRLGNKLIKQSSHLASGEKEGDELKRNADVTEILKGTQFPKICRTPNHRAPENIIEHEYPSNMAWRFELSGSLELRENEDPCGG